MQLLQVDIAQPIFVDAGELLQELVKAAIMCLQGIMMQDSWFDTSNTLHYVMGLLKVGLQCLYSVSTDNYIP